MTQKKLNPKADLISIIILLVIAFGLIGFLIFKLTKFYNYGLIRNNQEKEEQESTSQQAGEQTEKETGKEEDRPTFRRSETSSIEIVKDVG